jgi:subtilisin family serine protease
VRKDQKRAIAAFTLVIAILIGSFPANAKDNGKPSPAASPSTGQGQSNSNNSNKGSSAQPQATNNAKPAAPGAISSNPSPTSNASKSPNNSGNSNSNSNNQSTGSALIESTAPVSKKSSNVKLNPSKNAPGLTNTKAEKARNLSTTVSGDCKPGKDGKAPTGKDACSDFIVVFQPGMSRLNSNKLVKDSGAQVLRTFSNVFNGALVNGPLAKMQALANNPNVLVVEDDLEVSTTATQSPAPWGLDRIDQRPLPLSNSFDDGDLQGANTYSYVVDTGIDATNTDFEGRVAAGYTAVLDGRGSADCNGHGTHVAGSIGGKTYGVAKKTNLIPVRVLDCAGSGSYSSVIAGLDWIAANYRAGDAAVVNMSLGGPASSTLDGAVRNLISKGVTVVVAAGNSNADACNYSPARVLDVITVGATTSSDARASYSNFGTCLDVFAPGSVITSTWLGSTGTNTINGTSMASPHVAGVVARFLAQNPGLTPAQVANSIKTSSTKNLVTGAGSGSLNQLLFLNVLPDTTTVAPIDSSPTFKKVNPRGKKN